MRRSNSPLFIILLILLFSSCFRQEQNTEKQKSLRETSNNFLFEDSTEFYDFFDARKTNYPLISAHRGGPYPGYPENAIETFQYIADQMPAIIECDIQLTKDSVMVLMHDDDLRRTTTGRGKIGEMEYQELENLYLIDNDNNKTAYRIPTLEQALEWGKGKVIFTLDVKKNIPYDSVIAAIRRTNTEQSVVVITYSARQAQVLHKRAPDLMISASIKDEADLHELHRLGVPSDRIVAFVGTSAPEKSLYGFLKNEGIRSILGTLGRLDAAAARQQDELYATWLKEGADILSTDRPVEAFDVLQRYRTNAGITSEYVRPYEEGNRK